MDPRLHELLADQHGVVSREQALLAGLLPHDVVRLRRRRLLVPVHPGVYVEHTGQPTWLQRAWAAVLFAWPAELSHESALRAADGPGAGREGDALHIAVARDRRLVAPPGLRLHRTEHLHERVQWNAGPPRVRYDEALLDVAAASSSEFAALEVLARGVQGRRTSAARLRAALDGRERIRHRAWLEGVLDDVTAGTCSVLEQRYLRDVERRHGLTRARRQVVDRVGAGVVYRDVVYDCGLVVELDGRLFHDSTRQRDQDLERDLDTALGGRRTVRLGWGQVVHRSCSTAAKISVLLGRAGRPCRPGCPVSA